jgi:hypothetical protein
MVAKKSAQHLGLARAAPRLMRGTSTARARSIAASCAQHRGSCVQHRGSCPQHHGLCPQQHGSYLGLTRFGLLQGLKIVHSLPSAHKCRRGPARPCAKYAFCICPGFLPIYG